MVNTQICMLFLAYFALGYNAIVIALTINPTHLSDFKGLLLCIIGLIACKMLSKRLHNKLQKQKKDTKNKP
jgi:hypothetical protein